MNFESELEIFVSVYKTDKFDDWASGRIEDWEAAAKQGDVSADKMVAMDVHQCLYGLYEGNVENFGVAANMPADMIPAFKLAANNGCTEAREMLALYEKHVGEIPGGYTPATPAPAASPQPAATTPTPSSQPAQENDEAPALDPSLVEFAEATTGAKSSSKLDSGEQVHFRGSFHVIKPQWEDYETGIEEAEEMICATKEIEFTYCSSGNCGKDEWCFDDNFIAVLKPLMQEYKVHFEVFHPNMGLDVLCQTACIDGVPLDSDSEAFDKARWIAYENLIGHWESKYIP